MTGLRIPPRMIGCFIGDTSKLPIDFRQLAIVVFQTKDSKRTSFTYRMHGSVVKKIHSIQRRMAIHDVAWPSVSHDFLNARDSTAMPRDTSRYILVTVEMTSCRPSRVNEESTCKICSSASPRKPRSNHPKSSGYVQCEARRLRQSLSELPNRRACVGATKRLEPADRSILVDTRATLAWMRHDSSHRTGDTRLQLPTVGAGELHRRSVHEECARQSDERTFRGFAIGRTGSQVRLNFGQSTM